MLRERKVSVTRCRTNTSMDLVRTYTFVLFFLFFFLFIFNIFSPNSYPLHIIKRFAAGRHFSTNVPVWNRYWNSEFVNHTSTNNFIRCFITSVYLLLFFFSFAPFCSNLKIRNNKDLRLVKHFWQKNNQISRHCKHQCIEMIILQHINKINEIFGLDLTYFFC